MIMQMRTNTKQKLYALYSYSLTVTHMMMRKCVPHTTYHTFLLLPMIYANVYQTKALLSLFSLTLTHTS